MSSWAGIVADSQGDGLGSRDTHGRIPWYRPTELSSEQSEVYEAIVHGPRAGDLSLLMDSAGHLEGPFNAMLVSPQAGLAIQSVGSAIRYGTELSARQREIAILVTAAANRSDFEWLAHESPGRKAGLTEEELTHLRDGGLPVGAERHDQAVIKVVRSLLGERTINDSLFASAREDLGTTKIVELIFLVGYYQMLALALHALRSPLPEGKAYFWGPDQSGHG